MRPDCLDADCTSRVTDTRHSQDRPLGRIAEPRSVLTRRPVVCAGLVVADHLCPPIDQSAGGRASWWRSIDLVLNIGGGAANAAVDLARLGVRAAICARVGDDIFGRFATETLVAHGVDVGALRSTRERATSQTLIVNVRGEDRRFIHSVGANRGFTAADLDAVLDPAAAGPLHRLFPDPAGARRRSPGRAVRPGAARPDDHGARRGHPGPGDYLEPLQPVLPHTDVFLPNADEAALILGETDPVRQALAFRDMGAQRVVITRGEHGRDLGLRRASRPAGHLSRPPSWTAPAAATPSTPATSPGLLDGLSELDCLKLASAVGASCVRAVGTTAGVFTRPEADAFVKRHEIKLSHLPA